MLIKAKELRGYTLKSLDGDLGKVEEFYFDDKYWTIRYLIADTGGWLTGRQVLISPYSLESVNRDTEQISINLSKKQIESSPSLITNKPVSQQFEMDYFGYYGFPIYWGGPYMWGYNSEIVRNAKEWNKVAQEKKTWDPHLRSTIELDGYHIQANDDEIGHVEDFIVDDETWAIRYLVVDTKNWWAGKKVLVSTRWIEKISWKESKVFANLSRENIKQAPQYTEKTKLTRDYETKLHRHYNQQGYWSDEPTAVEHSHEK